ncbi:MAG TPA: XRE family transcriptional regulator [Parafilimonas sp.]|nr:XRE family transcriptional regulator [Parafilimonas sp.]
MKYFAERLKAARKMSGFSLQDLSDAINNKLNKQALNRLETGEAKPDSETLSLLCRSLHVTTDYFSRESLIALDDIRFRKLKKLPVKEQDKVLAQTTEKLERYMELEDILGINNNLTFRPKSYTITSLQDIEKAAQDLRKSWNLGEDPLSNIIEIFEENNIKVIEVDVDRSFSGMSTILNDKIAIVVLNINKEIPLVRQRFTALHEKAHLFLNLEPFDEKECEKMCDAFAGAMLLPASKARQYLGDKRTNIIMKELYMIAGQYGISLSGIMYRALNLGIITPSYHKFFMINYNRYNTKEKEFKVYEGRKQSERFLQLLIRAAAEEIISTTKAAALNNQKLGDFRELLDNAAR